MLIIIKIVEIISIILPLREYPSIEKDTYVSILDVYPYQTEEKENK